MDCDAIIGTREECQRWPFPSSSSPPFVNGLGESEVRLAFQSHPIQGYPVLYMTQATQTQGGPHSRSSVTNSSKFRTRPSPLSCAVAPACRKAHPPSPAGYPVSGGCAVSSRHIEFMKPYRTGTISTHQKARCLRLAYEPSFFRVLRVPRLATPHWPPETALKGDQDDPLCRLSIR